MTIEFLLLPRQAAFMLGEAVDFNVEVRNHGEDEVAVPRLDNPANEFPRYQLMTASRTTPLEFSVGKVRPGAGISRSQKVPGGQRYARMLPLDELAPVSDAGEYKLSGQIWVGGQEVSSEEVTFSVVAPERVALALGQARGAPEAMDLQAAWIFHGAGLHLAHWREFSDSAEDDGLILVTAALRAAEVPAEAGQPVSVSLADWKERDALGWMAWLEPGAVVAAPRKFTQVVLRVEVPGAATLVGPALAVDEGALEAFVIGDDGSVSLVRLAAPRRLPRAEPVEPEEEPAEDDSSPELVPFDPLEGLELGASEVRWTASLPEAPQAAAAGLGPNHERVLAFARDHDGGVEVWAAHCGAGDALGPFGSAVVPGARLIPDTSLGVSVDPDGTTRVAVPFQAASDEEIAVGLAQVAFSPGGRVRITDGSPSRVEAGLVASAPVSAAASFYVPAVGPPRCEWAAALEDGSTVGSVHGAGLQVFAHVQEVIRPVQIAALERSCVIATLSNGTPKAQYLFL